MANTEITTVTSVWIAAGPWTNLGSTLLGTQLVLWTLLHQGPTRVNLEIARYLSLLYEGCITVRGALGQVSPFTYRKQRSSKW